MITDLEDFCTWAYVIVDDIWQQIASLFKRPGPSPKCSDSELIAMVLIGETVGWDVGIEMLNHWKEHKEMFPNIPSQSRNLTMALNLMRRVILGMLDLAQDRQCVIGSLPAYIPHPSLDSVRITCPHFGPRVACKIGLLPHILKNDTLKVFVVTSLFADSRYHIRFNASWCEETA